MGDMKKRPVKPGNIMMGIAAVLFCLVLFSTHLMGGLYARYTVSGRGSDSARVAQFGTLTLTETGDFAEDTAYSAMIIPGVDLTKDVQVTWNGSSEVAVVVFAEARLSDHWTEADGVFSLAEGKLRWQVAAGWKRLEDVTEIVYYQQLAPHETLPQTGFIAENGQITVSEELTKSQMKALAAAVRDPVNPITVSVQAWAVQTDGSMTVKALWESLKGGAA